MEVLFDSEDACDLRVDDDFDDDDLDFEVCFELEDFLERLFSLNLSWKVLQTETLSELLLTLI